MLLAMTKLQRSQLDAWRAALRGQALVLEEVERTLAAAGLPPISWYDVLTELAKAGGRLRIHELADAVIFSRSGLSRLLDRIEADGLIRRERTDEDRRGAYAVITPAGIRTLERMWNVYDGCLSEHFGPHVSPAAAGQIQTAFESVADSVRSERA